MTFSFLLWDIGTDYISDGMAALNRKLLRLLSVLFFPVS